jgi:hypothetical protein
MPVPGMGAPLNRGQQPPDRQSQPIMEDVVEEHFSIPYRGDVDHGQPVRYDDPETLEAEDLYGETVGFDHEIEQPTPVPVKIVSSGGRELRMSRINTVPIVDPTIPVRILGQHENRISAMIALVPGSFTAYLSDRDQGANANFGFQLNPAGTQTLSTTAQTALWAGIVDIAKPATLMIYEEYSVEIP